MRYNQLEVERVTGKQSAEEEDDDKTMSNLLKRRKLQ
jgi:hypothetical protein